MKQKNPGKDIHHLLSSTFGKKFSDSLIVPLDHSFHIKFVTANEAKYFDSLLPAAIAWLKLYARELGIETDQKEDPHSILKLTRKIYKETTNEHHYRETISV